MLRRGGGRSFTPELRSWISAIPARPSSAWLNAADNFVRDMKSANVWDMHDGINIFWTPDQATALVDFKVPTRVSTLVMTPTFTANKGFSGTGTVGEYIDTGFVPSTMGVAYQQDSASIGTFLNSNIPSNAISIGTNIGSSAYFISRSVGGYLVYRINDVTTVTSADSTDGSGLTIVSRTGPNATQAYQRGAAFGAAGTNASTTRPTASIKYLTAGAGASGLFQVGAGFIGAGVNATQAAALSSIFTRFGQAVGAIP